MTNPQDAYTMRIIEQLEQWLATLDDEVMVVCWYENEFIVLIPFGQIKYNCRKCLKKVDCYSKNLIPAFENGQQRDNGHNTSKIPFKVYIPNDSDEIPFQPDPMFEED